MILKPGNPFGFITGKLSMNPEQALRSFGFVMNPDAPGVLLRVYTMTDENNKNPHKVNIICNYFPSGNPQTPDQQANRMKMKAAVRAWQGLSEEDKKKWNREASRRKLKMSGYNLHNSQHLKGIPGGP